MYDQETQLYYLQSRYYDPAIGRFINADGYLTTEQGLLSNNLFAYCLNNPVCRKDSSGTTSVDIYEPEGNPLTDDDERIDGGKISNSNNSSSGAKGATSSSQATQTGSSNAPVANGNQSTIPQSAYDTWDYVNNHNGSPPSGYKGGKTFANDGRDGSARLPNRYAPYREYDIRPKFVGQSRGPERIVVGSGVAFYTPDHYKTFLQM